MPLFSTAPVAEVAPRKRLRAPSQRAQTRAQYEAELRNALVQGVALVIELKPEDKALTIRSRVRRAAEALGREDVQIRRRGTCIIAYPSDEAAESHS